MFVQSVHMLAQRIFALKCLLTMVTIVDEMTREVNAFNMVSDICSVSVFFPTQGALVAWPSILKHRLLHVLVKHPSFIRARASLKSKFTHHFDNLRKF